MNAQTGPVFLAHPVHQNCNVKSKDFEHDKQLPSENGRLIMEPVTLISTITTVTTTILTATWRAGRKHIPWRKTGWHEVIGRFSLVTQRWVGDMKSRHVRWKRVSKSIGLQRMFLRLL